MQPFSKYFAVSGNCFNSSTGYYDLNDQNDYLTFSITLSSSDVPDFQIVESAFIYLKHRNYCSDVHNIRLYLVEDNQDKLIDYAIKRNIDYERLVFDVTPLFFKNKRKTYTFKVKYSGNDLNEIYDGSSSHRLYIECVKEESLTITHPSLSKSISNRLTYSLNLVSGSYLFTKNLPNDVLKYDLSLVYDCKSDDSFAFFPKSWKLSILERIIINRNNNNEIDSIEYIDSSYQRHTFKTDADSSPYFYDENGTGLIIEIVSGGYKLSNGISIHGYKNFNSDGYISEIKDAYNRSITFSYYLSQFILQNSGNDGGLINESGNDIQFIDPPGPIEPVVLYRYIDITDYDGHIVRIKQAFNSSTKVYIEIYENQAAVTSSTALYSFELNVSSDYLTSIKEGSNNLTYIDYNNNHQITALREFTGYECYLSYCGEKPDSITHKYSLDIIDRYSVDYQFGRIITNDYYNIQTAYVYYSVFDEGLTISNELASNYGYLSFASKRFISFPANGRKYSYQGGQFVMNDIGAGLIVENGKKYIAIIRLTKASEQDSNPVIPTEFKTDLKLTIDYSLQDSEDVYLASYSKQKDFFFIFQANSSFNPIFTVDTGHYPNLIALDIYLFEFKEEYLDDYYFTRSSGNYHYGDDDNVLSLGGESCGKKDVNINKILKACSSPLRWAYNKRKLLNNANLTSYQYKQNGITLFDNLSISDTVFKEKKIVRTIDDDVTRYPIYSLSTFQYTSGKFVLNIDTIINQDTYHSHKKFDTLFRLVEEENNEGIKTSYEYDDDKVVAKITSDTNDTINSKTELSYDTKDRLIEQIDDRYFINSVTELVYQNSFLSPSSVTKNTSNTVNYSYANDHLRIEELSTDLYSSISYTYLGDNLTEFNNDTYFRYSYGDYNLFNDFSIKIGSSYLSIVSVNTLLDEDGNDATVNYADGFERRTYFNKYGNINYIAHGYVVAAKYLYFDSKPNDLDSLTSCEDPSVFSKLYKIIDNCSNTYSLFDYNDKGGLSNFEQKKSNASLISGTLTYDVFSRLTNKNIETASNSFEITYLYENNNSSAPYEISIVSGDAIDQIQVSEKIENDSLKRLSIITTTFNSTYSFYSEYIYPEQTIENKNYSSLFPTRINEYYQEEGTLNETYLHSSYIAYDNNGQIISIHRGDQNYAFVFSGQDYGYDNKNQLITETNHDLGYRFVYSYDGNGNITSVAKYDLSNNLISTDTYSYHSSYKDLLFSFNNQCITYDANYNPITIGSASLSWTRGRLLNSITIDNIQTSFDYDCLEYRTNKTTGNALHEYIYDENHRLIEEIITTNNVVQKVITFIYGLTGIIGIKVNENLYRFEKNILNDVVAIYEEDTLVAKYVYDAYGNHIVLDENGYEEDDPDFIGNFNPIRYRSYYYDRETGLYYCQSRYYNPTFRRWLNMDMVSYQDAGDIIGINLFCYCKNNPIMYSDETGHDIAAIIIGLIIGAIIGTGVGFGVALDIDYKNDQKLFNGDVQWYDYLGASVIGSLIGGALGAGAGYLSGLSWTFSIQSSNISGGAAALPLSFTIAGSDVMSIMAGLLAGSIMFSKNADRYKKPGSNYNQNRYIDHLQQKYGFDDDIRRRLHDRITKRGLTKRIIEEILRRLLGL